MNENYNAKENINTITENNDVNSLNKEDLINQLNYMNQKLISLENIIQQKDEKIFSLAKTNEKLTQNFEMINKALTDILDKKAKEQLKTIIFQK